MNSNLLSMPFVDGFNVAKHHSLLSALQVVWHWNIAFGISDLGDIAVKQGDRRQNESFMTSELCAIALTH